VHTFILVNAEGKETFVKFHWRPKDGAKFLMDDETDNVGATPSTKHSHATEDLTSSIEKGDFPEWTFYVQLMDPSQQIDYEFDVLDATKYWPDHQFPLIEVGRMVLDENVSNFHNESEMIAFSPGVTVNGIEPSNDKLLQSRIMSYSDAQRYRLGVNYLQLPVNAPKCPYHNNHNEGTMNVTQKDEEVNYWPSKVEHTAEAQAGGAPNRVSRQPVEGGRVQADLPNPGSDFKQAGERIRSWDDDRRARFRGRLVAWLEHPKCAGEIRDTWIDFWSQCDANFGKELQQDLAEQ
jgi:catalase